MPTISRSRQLFHQTPRLRLASIVRRNLPAGRQFKNHAHPFYELALMFEGACEWQLPNRTWSLNEGQLLLLAPGRFHREKVEPGTGARQGWVGFELDHELPRAWQAPVASGAYFSEFKRLYRVVYEEHQSATIGAELRSSLALHEILILFCRLFEAPEALPPGSMDGRQMAGAAAQTIRANLQAPIPIRQLADYHSLSVSRFSAVFREIHGMGPGRFLQKARVERARQLLRDSEYSIKEIAALCGYADSAHFSHAFSRACGRSPRAYRRADVRT